MRLQPIKLKIGLTTTVLAIGFTTAQQVIVDESFNGTGESLNASTTEIFNAAITAAGGSNIWVSSDSFSDNGEVALGSFTNSSAHLNLGTYINDSKGTPAGVFELTMTIGDVTGAGNIWLSMGFSALNSPGTDNHFLNRAATGTIILRGSGQFDMWAGTGNANMVNGPTGNTGDRTLTVALDLSTHDGIDDFGSVTWSDSLLGVINSHTYFEDVDFSSIFLSEANGTLSTLSNLTLTQVIPPSNPSEIIITEIDYSPAANLVTLTWTSDPNETYTVQVSSDLLSWDSDIGDGITMANDDDDNTDDNRLTDTFDLTSFALNNEAQLFFRIQRN